MTNDCIADDGCRCECERCEVSFEADMAYWRGKWAVASPEERDPGKYLEDMIDAGRGYLLP